MKGDRIPILRRASSLPVVIEDRITWYRHADEQEVRVPDKRHDGETLGMLLIRPAMDAAGGSTGLGCAKNDLARVALLFHWERRWCWCPVLSSIAGFLP